MEITNEEFAERLDKIFKGMKELLILKNKSYGSASFTGNYKFAISGNCHRLNDKINRYINMINSLLEHKELDTFDENIKDTLKDIIGYAVIGLIICNNNDNNPDNDYKSSTKKKTLNHKKKSTRRDKKNEN